MLKLFPEHTDELTAYMNTSPDKTMNESTFKQFVFQRIETHFPCENPEDVFNSMLAQAKEMYPKASQEKWLEWVVFGLIIEFNDKTLDFIYHAYTKSNFQEGAQAA